MVVERYESHRDLPVFCSTVGSGWDTDQDRVQEQSHACCANQCDDNDDGHTFLLHIFCIRDHIGIIDLVHYPKWDERLYGIFVLGYRTGDSSCGVCPQSFWF